MNSSKQIFAFRFWLLGVLTVLLLSVSGPVALATLGEPESSVAHDSQVLQVSERVNVMSKSTSFAVHELNTSAVQVRQFANLSKTSAPARVFGLTWKGMAPPVNMSDMLGRYRDEYAAAFAKLNAQKKPLLRTRTMYLETEHLVIERAGHLRSITGRVVVKDLLPKNVNINEIR